MGWSSFSKSWARCYSITIHTDSLQLHIGPHTWLRNTSSLSQGERNSKIFFFFFSQIGQHLAISTVCVMPTNIPHAIKKNEIQERSRVNPAHHAEHVTRTQTSDKAVRPSLIYQKYYILRLQAFTGSHSSLLKHPIGTGKEGRKRQPDMGI